MFDIIDIGKTKLIFSKISGIKTASLGVFIPIGSRHEKKPLRGIAHYLEHMIFKGSKNYSYKQVKREIEGRGGMLNGFTSQEVTAYYSQFLNKNINLTLDILMDMVLHPDLARNEIAKERNVILEEVKMHNDLPHIRVGTILEKLLWEGHPLGEEIIGEVSTINHIQRKDLVDFQKAYYAPNNLVICAVGDLDKEKLIQQIKNKIKGIAGPKVLDGVKAPIAFKKTKVSVEKRMIDQSHLCLGFRGPSYTSSERVTSDLLSIVLGGNMSSRLFEEIREKKALCYDVSTETRKFKDSGAFVVHIGLNRKNISIAVKSILKELKRIKKVLVPKAELRRAQDFLLGQVHMSMEKPQGRMFQMADSYLALGKINTLKSAEKKILDVDSERIRKVASSIFDFGKVCVSCVTNGEKGLDNELRQLIKVSS